jgi:enoyl-CoA hydratase/carnithine racemase
MTTSPERQRAEREARMLLKVMAYPIPVVAVVVFWALGLAVHPHRIVFAGIITACAVAWGVGSTWLLYWTRMKAARKL